MCYARYDMQMDIEPELIYDNGVFFEPWFDVRHRYVALYLDFITEDEKGMSYSFDLVTSYGLTTYIESLGETPISQDIDIPNRIATYIQLRNIKQPLHVEEKQYYLLRLDSLDHTRLTREVTALYMSVYNYADIEGDEASIPDLIPLPGMVGLVYSGPKLPNPQIPSFPNGMIGLRVNNVKRGNWNEILVNNEASVVYDIGTNKEIKQRTSYIENLIQAHSYQGKPSLIISHWDLDHYNALLYMSDVERLQFSQVIAPSTLPSQTPFRLIQKIHANANIKLSLVDNNFTLKNGFCKKIDTGNPMLNFFVCPLKMSSRRVNTNESGIIVDVDAPDINVLLTGDCIYNQANDVIKQSYDQINQDKNHYLVVPHHGGGKYPDYQIPRHCILKTAVISVDELETDKSGKVARHRYGHPTKEVVYHFIKKHTCQLLRTDYANDDIVL